jgi:excisionase family DNA binding protein
VILLASGSTLLKRFGGEPWFGQLIDPASSNAIRTPNWAADNAAFRHFDPAAYRRMVERKVAVHPTPPIFLTVPDVVGDAHQTRHAFAFWYEHLRRFRLPLAYVLQDGERADFVPWSLIAAVFVGGTTAYKLGADARALVDAAKARKLWVHMGRVNTRRRVLYAQQIGCDSVDGTGFARFPDDKLRRFLQVNDHGVLDWSGDGARARVLWTPLQAATRLGVRRSLVLRLIRRRDLAGVKVGRAWRVEPEAVEAYIATRRQDARPVDDQPGVDDRQIPLFEDVARLDVERSA